MSIETEPVRMETAKPAPRPRPLSRRVLHWVRRLHLFLGLFLLPWALLYGVSGFINTATLGLPPSGSNVGVFTTNGNRGVDVIDGLSNTASVSECANRPQFWKQKTQCPGVFAASSSGNPCATPG